MKRKGDLSKKTGENTTVASAADSRLVWPDGPPPGEALSREPSVGARLRLIYRLLLRRFGPRGWWPADSPFEVMVGAVLTQNTAWRNVEKAMVNLRAAGLLLPERMRGTPVAELAELVRPSGFYKLKADRLRNMTGAVLSFGAGGARPAILDLPADVLRESLLGVKGIGRETADCVVLYAAGRPSFVVDAYTRRLLRRHSLASGREDYDAVRGWFMGHLGPDAGLYNEYHALVVAAGHRHCGPKSPDCAACPLGADPWLRPDEKTDPAGGRRRGGKARRTGG
jgi:endonuclease-3 related protein